MSASLHPAGEPGLRIELDDGAPARRAGLDLHLTITDPEVVEELAAIPDARVREQHALSALRIGVLSLRLAGSNVDAEKIRTAGGEVISEIRELLTERFTAIHGQISGVLQGYLDPRVGTLPQRLEALVKNGGELERTITSLVGPGDSVLARSMANAIGERSPIFRLLSPDEAHGIKAQIEAVLAAALREQNQHIQRQFSLDVKDSALSRVVEELRSQQGTLGTDLGTRVDALLKQLTLDDDAAALARMKKQIDGSFTSLLERQQIFHDEVRTTLAALQARKQEAARSTTHGRTFEEDVGAFLAREAGHQGDVLEACGDRPGALPRQKVGDFAVELGSETSAPGARIVFEAKESQSYSLKRALEELGQARENREAQVGVFVWSRRSVPDGMVDFQRFDRDVVVIWDAEDPSSDAYLKAAYSLARALCVEDAAEAGDLDESREAVESARARLEKLATASGEIRKQATAIQTSSGKILQHAQKLEQELEAAIGELDEATAGMVGE